MAVSARKKLVRLLVICLLLWVYAFTRWHNLMALPLFVDESFHIDTAQRFWDGQPLISAAHGRLLRVWGNALVGPYAPGAGFMTRVLTVWASLIGLAAFYALARGMVSRRAGVIAMVLWISAPYLAFYERMALADPMLGALSVLAAWIAWVMWQTCARWAALLLGSVLAAVLLAKASGVVWLPLPVVVLILAEQIPWRKRVELGALVYGGFSAICGPLFLVLHLKNYNYFGLASVFTGGVNQSLPERLWQNMQDTWHFDAAYLSAPLVLLAVAGGLYWLWRQPRRALLALLLLGMGGGGAIVFGQQINSRYALNHVVWVLLPLAAGITLLIERDRRWQWVALVAWAGWLIVFVLPFQLDLWNDPAALDLYGNDSREYIVGEASGYGVTELGTRLQTLPGDPLPVLGFVANCQTLRLAAYPVDVTCPPIKWDGTSQHTIMALAESWAAQGPIYVVGEQLPYIDLTELPQPHAVIATVERPGGTSDVMLYRIEQGAVIPSGD